MAPEPVSVTVYTDPSCPWAYSAEPFLRGLEWRYGDGLAWRTVVIGLCEDTRARERAGVTPASRVRGWKQFEARFGMPVASTPRTRLIASGRACRAVKAAAAQGDGASRADAAGAAAGLVHDHAPARRRRGASPRSRTGSASTAPRSPPGSPTRRSRPPTSATGPRPATRPRAARRPSPRSGPPSRTPGARFTAPSLVFTRGASTLVAGGWQPFDAYDLCVANLAPELPRRPAPEPADLLAAFPDGLTTVEVAQVCRERNDDRDTEAAAAALAAARARRAGPADTHRR